MIEKGRVVEIRGNIAKVELDPNDKCSGCPASGICELVGGDSGKRFMEVEKKSEIKVGDKVKIEIKSGYFLKGTIFLFLIPAVSFIIGAAVGQTLMEGIALSLFLGFSFLAVTFFFLHLLDKKLAEKNRPRIISIL